MMRRAMGVCLLFLGLATAAGVREGREFPPDDTFPSEEDSRARLQLQEAMRAWEQRAVAAVGEAVRLQVEQMLRLQEQRVATTFGGAVRLQLEDVLRQHEERSSTALTDAVRMQVGEIMHLQEQRTSTVLTEALLLQEQRTEAAVRDALRLQGQETASALREAVRQVLQERDEAALRRTLDERLQRLEEGARAFGEPSTPSPEREDAAPAPTGGPAPLQQLERRVLDLEATFNSLQPLSTAQAPPATPSPSAPAPPPATAPSAPEASAAGGAANDGHNEQAERRRVEQRIQEVEARMERAREQPSSLGEALLNAASIGSHHQVEHLLDKGADVNYTDSAERFPLYAAIWSSRSPQEKLSLLLRRGADPNAVDKDGWSALHYAAAEGKSSDVLLLLGAGAEVDHGHLEIYQASAKEFDVIKGGYISAYPAR